MGLVDPYQELKGRDLRSVVLGCLVGARVLIPQMRPQVQGSRSHAEERMAERHVSAPEIESALRSGVLSTSCCVAGKWRYSARRGDVEVVFTFDLDDDGNLLVVVTVMRREGKNL